MKSSSNTRKDEPIYWHSSPLPIAIFTALLVLIGTGVAAILQGNANLQLIRKIDMKSSSSTRQDEPVHWHSSPLLKAILTTLVGIFGTGALAVYQGYANSQFERQKFEFSLIQQALSASDEKEVAKQLLFMVDLGVIQSLDRNKITEKANKPESLPQPFLAPQVDIPVEIVSVIGAGTLDAEWVVVSYKGADPINLANWQLRDSNRHVFVFPQLVLHKDGAVQIHTTSGTDTVIDLYWGERDPIWESGEEAQLYDPSGNPHASYKVP